eukprot:gene5171-18394_t
MGSNDSLSGLCIRGFSCPEITSVILPREKLTIESSYKLSITKVPSLLSFQFIQVELGIESPDIVPEVMGSVDEELRTYERSPNAGNASPFACSEAVRIPTTCYFKDKSMLDALKLFQRARVHYKMMAEKESSSGN